jgi:nifR3 family TIM-barrel protein
MPPNIWKALPRPFFVLAPMDDVTDTVFRQIISSLAPPDVYFTEFVSVDGLQSPGRPRLLKRLQFTEAETPLIAQLWGKKPENYYQTAKELAGQGYAGIDLNMGCPVKVIVKNGCCSALINDRPLAAEIITATKAGAGKLPVSVKTRLGYNEVDLTWHEFLLNQGIAALTIHGRTKKDLSKVPANWELIGKIRELRDQLSPDTVIIGNGDVTSRQQGETLAKQFELDGIMIGRGVFDDPFVFSHKSPWLDMTKSQKIDLYRRHVELFASTWMDNERKLPMLNKYCKIYLSGFPGAKEYRESIMQAATTDELLSLLDVKSSEILTAA